MSYHHRTPRYSLGQVPQAVAVTCIDGAIIGVPPGGDADALCREHHLKATPPPDEMALPYLPPLPAADTSSATQPSVTQPQILPMQPFVQPQPLPVDTTPTWIVPAIYAGVFGFLLWAAKSA